MKMSFELIDGGILIGYSSEEFVRELRKLNRYGVDGTDRDFMKHFADEYKKSKGKDIRVDNANNFLYDLKKNGYVL